MASNLKVSFLSTSIIKERIRQLSSLIHLYQAVDLSELFGQVLQYKARTQPRVTMEDYLF
uniref:Uncharacterized protein n=1 Tax=Arundo donax TaxID=35708 RepID=A0A0A9GXL2_ARUDO